MADVVRYGTQYLTDTDAHAMATYLRQLPQTASRPRPDASAAASPELDAFLQQGKGLYDKHCDGCHGISGEGQPGVYPALAASRTVSMARTNNLAHVVLRGGYAPSTQGNPRPYGMPPFVLTLSDAEMAAVLSYIRYQWGNTGSPVAEFDITSMRR
jgi:mono/diheme cytochrome c family protein